MTASVYFVGIDVCKKYLDVAVRPDGRQWRVERTPEGIAALVKELTLRLPTLALMEATAGLEKEVAAALAAAGVPVAIVNAKRIRDFAKASGRLAKTDRLDAEVLAHFAETFRPASWKAPTPEEEELEALVTRRQNLVQFLKQEGQRLQASGVSALAKESLESHIKWLETEKARIEKLIEKMLRTEYFLEKATLLRSAKGVGPVATAALLAFLPELGALDRKQVAALVGLAPMNDDSGDKGKPRHIRGGRAELRQLLYMAALVATRHNPSIKAAFTALMARGKPFKVAMVACMRKLLCSLNAMVRDGEAWRAPETEEATECAHSIPSNPSP